MPQSLWNDYNLEFIRTSSNSRNCMYQQLFAAQQSVKNYQYLTDKLPVSIGNSVTHILITTLFRVHTVQNISPVYYDQSKGLYDWSTTPQKCVLCSKFFFSVPSGHCDNMKRQCGLAFVMAPCLQVNYLTATPPQMVAPQQDRFRFV